MQSVHDPGRSFSSEATGTAGPIFVDYLSRTWAALLFEVFSQRYERGSILVNTNLPFDEWAEIFGSERLTGALLDRLTHHVHIVAALRMFSLGGSGPARTALTVRPSAQPFSPSPAFHCRSPH